MKVEDGRILFFFFQRRPGHTFSHHLFEIHHFFFLCLLSCYLHLPHHRPLRWDTWRLDIIINRAPACLDPSQSPHTHNQGGCMQCLPSYSTAQLSADPGWKSCTHCGKIKDNNIPFLLPQTASIFNPFLACKTKTPCPSPCRSQGTLAHVTQIHMPHLIQKSHLHRPIRDI